MTNYAPLETDVGKFRAKSPNIASAFDETEKILKDHDAQIAAAMVNPPPSGGAALMPRSPNPSGGDDQPALQAWINSLPNGSAGALALGTFRLDRPLDFSSKYALRIEGLGNRGFNEGGLGSTLISGVPGISLVKDISLNSVKHTSVNFEYVNFVDHKGGCTGVELTGTNHWIFHHCSWEGEFAQGALLQNLNNMDNAYGLFEACNWSMHGGLAIWGKSGEANVKGGNIASKSVDWAAGGGCIRLDSDGSTIEGPKWNNSGMCLDLRGGCHKIIGCQFECYEKPGALDEWIVSVTRPGAGLSGNRNIFMGCTLIGHGNGQNFMYFGPGTYKNLVGLTIAENPKLPFKNDGASSGTDANKIDILV